MIHTTRCGNCFNRTKNTIPRSFIFARHTLFSRVVVVLVPRKLAPNRRRNQYAAEDCCWLVGGTLPILPHSRHSRRHCIAAQIVWSWSFRLEKYLLFRLDIVSEQGSNCPRSLKKRWKFSHSWGGEGCCWETVL